MKGFPPSREFQHALARASIDARSLAGGTNYRRFVIVGIARTGSTLLINLLNSHSQALTFGELFRSPDAIGWDVAPYTKWQSAPLLALYQRDPLAFLHRAVYRRWPRITAAVGFKLFYYHARTHPYSAIWDYLRDDPDIVVLHIKRRNILEQYLSLRRAHLTDVWSSAQSSDRTGEPLRLEPDACRRHFEEVRAFEAECDAYFSGHAVLPIAYEDLAADSAAEMQKVQHFLGLEPERVSSRTQRQRVEPISRAISNFEDLKAAFAGTEWESFFTDSDGGQ